MTLGRGVWLATGLVGLIGGTVVVSLALGAGPEEHGLKVAEIVRGPIKRSVRLTGTLQPRRRHNVTFQSNGRVERVLVQVGSHVRKGDLLGNLESLQARFAIARREFELRRARLRAKTTDENRDEHDSDLSTLEVEQAEFELEVVQQQLSSLEARSPVSGVVVWVGVQPGDPPTGAVPFVIVEDDEYVVEAEGEEGEVRGAVAGARAIVTFAPPGAAMIQGTVEGSPSLRRLAANGAASQWSLRIRLNRNPDDTNIGRTARVEIETGSRDQVVAASIQALFRFNGADYVLVVQSDGSAKPTPVTVGLSDDSLAELVTGPRPGTAVLVGPSERLRELASNQLR